MSTYVVVTAGRLPGRFVPDVLGPFEDESEAQRLAVVLRKAGEPEAIVRPIMAAWPED